MVRRYRYVLAGVLVALIVAAGALYAQDGGVRRFRGPGPGGPGIGVPLQALNLTEAQREQVRQVTEQHREQTRPLIERLRASQLARRQAIETMPVDEGRIRAAMQDAGASTANPERDREQGAGNREQAAGGESAWFSWPWPGP